MSLDLDAIEARARAATEGPARVQVCACGLGCDDRSALKVGGSLLIDCARDADVVFAAAAWADIPALIAEVRRLRATTLPTRIDAPDGSTAEVVSVRVRLSSPRGTEFQSVSVETWRRQGNGREELRDLARGGDRGEG